MSYIIADIDAAMKEYIESFQLTVNQDNQDIVLPVQFSYPDRLEINQRFPLINIESGFSMKRDTRFTKEDRLSYADNLNNVDITTTKLIDVFWRYRIGYYVYYKRHQAEIELAMLQMFPPKFLLPIKGNTEKVDCSSISPLNLDERMEDYMVYRSDYQVTAHLCFENQYVETELRPYNGVVID